MDIYVLMILLFLFSAIWSVSWGDAVGKLYTIPLLNTYIYTHTHTHTYTYIHTYVRTNKHTCIQKFPDWPPGTRATIGTDLCHKMQLYRCLVSFAA